jgi:hypothetical protein
VEDHGLSATYFHGQTNFVKLAFVRLLQAAFSDESVPAIYRWAPPKQVPAGKPQQGDRQLWIYRANPNRTTGLPAIFVEADPADCSIGQMGSGNAEIMGTIYAEDPNNPGKQYLKTRIHGGTIFIPVKLTIVAKTTSDRGILTDFVTGLVRVVFRQKFQESRIEYLDIEAGDSGEEGDTPANKRFFGSLKVRCQTQSKLFVDESLRARVMSVNLAGLQFKDAEGDILPIPSGT